jgi:hypothetical protein
MALPFRVVMSKARWALWLSIGFFGGFPHLLFTPSVLNTHTPSLVQAKQLISFSDTCSKTGSPGLFIMQQMLIINDVTTLLQVHIDLSTGCTRAVDTHENRL